MSTLKEYARRAKQRMKSGFWENARENMQKEKEVAATLGLDSYQVASRQHAALQRQIYDYDAPQEKQLYISRLSARYREAVERFSRERR